MNTTTTNLNQMNANQELWEKGDFTKLAATMRRSGERLVASLGITRDLDVLDLGCGDGTTAIPAARLGAKVSGLDIARNLVAAGNKWAKEEGLENCVFEQADAGDLFAVANNSFDLVVTIFGAMFAARPEQAAKEMVRVTRPGGRIIMGNWIPGDPTLVAQILRISAANTPAPPEGFVSPVLWGKEEVVTERFVAAGIPKENISFSRETFTFEADIPASGFLKIFRNYYGPTMNAFAAAEKLGKTEALQQELEALFNSQNNSEDPARTVIPATFLQVTVVVPGKVEYDC